MSIIATLKSTFLKNNKTNDLLFRNCGLRFFQLGVLFLAAFPAIAFLLLTISSFIGSFNREDNYFRDKYNLPLLIIGLLMTINTLYITLIDKNSLSYDISNIWIGLSNWLPFFWCFWGFQPFLKDGKLRFSTAKILIFGSLPVLLSCFSQYFLKIYGPYKFFNDLIIWYQRPLGETNAVTGLFNNQNYTGAWLCIILPLCLFFVIRRSQNNIKNILSFLLCFSFVYIIILTSSRGAILSIFITIFLFTRSFRNKIYILISFISVPIILNLIPLFFTSLKSSIYSFLPYELIQKTSIINMPNLNFLPRIEIWSKSFDLIKSNFITGYGAGTFGSLYNSSNGSFEGIQHTHNIFIEIALSHGLPSAILFFLILIFITFYAWKINSKINNKNQANFNHNFWIFDKAWIISFICFFLIHIFDITYFDGRISILAWILLSGMRSIIKEKTSTNKQLNFI